MEDGSRRNDPILEADDGATIGSSAVSLLDQQRRHEAGGDDPVRLRRLVDLLLRYINLAVR